MKKISSSNQKYHLIFIVISIVLISACSSKQPQSLQHTHPISPSDPAQPTPYHPNSGIPANTNSQNMNNYEHGHLVNSENTVTNNSYYQKPPGYSISTFSYYLAEAYMDLTQQENFKHDFISERAFRNKAIQAKQGMNVQADQVQQRKIPSHAVSELLEARNNLVQVISSVGVTSEYPYLSAQAQVKFDCWLEEQEENINQYDIAICRKGFYKFYNLLKDKLVETSDCSTKAEIKKPPKKQCCCVSVPTAPLKGFILYFKLNRSELTSDAIKLIREIKIKADQAKPKKIIVQGHTDRAGKQAYNTILSRERINSVVAGLTVAGIPKKMIMASYFGETKPKVKTKDGKVLAENRRVEVKFEF